MEGSSSYLNNCTRRLLLWPTKLYTQNKITIALTMPYFLINNVNRSNVAWIRLFDIYYKSRALYMYVIRKYNDRYI